MREAGDSKFYNKHGTIYKYTRKIRNMCVKITNNYCEIRNAGNMRFYNNNMLLFTNVTVNFNIHYGTTRNAGVVRFYNERGIICNFIGSFNLIGTVSLFYNNLL